MATSSLRKTLDRLSQVLIPDEQLLQNFVAQRDEAAFAALVRRHGPMVLGVCRRILGNPHDTDDAFQATFLVLARKARAVSHRAALGSWLYTVAYRIALEAKAQNVRRRQRERQVEQMPQPEVPATELHDWQPILDQELNRLAEKYRAPIILCDLEGRSRREVARQLGLAEGTLSSRLTTARRQLAQRLARRGVTLSGAALAAALTAATASACVPPPLVTATARAAVLVAAGQLATIAAPVSILMKGGINAMFIAKLKAAIATVLVVTALGAGSLVYCAGSGAGQGQAPAPKTELDALRKENELLKVNLRVTLEKIQALENEIVALKERVKTSKVGQGVNINDFDKDGMIDLFLGTSKMDAALKMLDQALQKTQDQAAVQQAIEALERAAAKLKKNRPGGKPSEPKKF